MFYDTGPQVPCWAELQLAFSQASTAHYNPRNPDTEIESKPHYKVKPTERVFDMRTHNLALFRPQSPLSKGIRHTFCDPAATAMGSVAAFPTRTSGVPPAAMTPPFLSENWHLGEPPDMMSASEEDGGVMEKQTQ